MQPNPQSPMNGMIRQAGNRSRALPNIGQTPAVQAANLVMGQGPAGPMAQGAPPTVQPQQPPQQQMPQPSQTQNPQPPSPMAAPPMQNSFTLHPPGSPADPNQYNYEPQADGSWRVYPPGVPAPNHTVQASLPRAASTADYRRMRQAFERPAPTQQPAPLV